MGTGAACISSRNQRHQEQKSIALRKGFQVMPKCHTTKLISLQPILGVDPSGEMVYNAYIK